MTHTTSFSTMTGLHSFSRRNHRITQFFDIEVVDYDGESYSWDVEAVDQNEAEQLANNHFAAINVDIYHMSIYKY